MTGANGSGGDVANDGPDLDLDGRCDGSDSDVDGDGVVDTADAAPRDPTLCRDVDNDSCDDCSTTQANGSGGNPAADGTDTDRDGACDAGDPDDDGDGVADVSDDAPLDADRCHDADGDGCDDCAVTRADGSGGNPMNDGADRDGDGKCDVSDDDSDNDGVPDAVDSSPLNPIVCSDLDRDGCDDCSLIGALGRGGNVSGDGPDTDGDGQCDGGDPDDDNDGVPDALDTAPADAAKCGDADKDHCDDCSRTGSNASGGDPRNDGVDLDGNGACDIAQDEDGDGIGASDDLDADNDGIPNRAENTLGLEPFADHDKDGIANYLDADDRGDGSAGSCADENKDGRCEHPSKEFDSDTDGIPNHLDLDSDADSITDLDEAGHGAKDADRDGRVEGTVGKNGLVDSLESKPDNGELAYELPDFDVDGTPDFLDLDADGDTIEDAIEAGDRELATLAVDTDLDEAPDYIDVDSDNDGVLDRDDHCRLVVDGKNLDSDGDGIGDVCELQPAVDMDGDGVADASDNCPDVSNGSQLDRDRDGRGDACDDDANADGFEDDLSLEGGGCSVSRPGAAGSPWIALPLAIGAMLLRRSTRRRRGATALGWFIGVALLMSGHLAKAQHAAISVERFRLASTRAGVLDVESGVVGRKNDYSGGYWLGYAKNPLVVYRTTGGARERVGALVADRFAATFVGSYAPIDGLQVSLVAPVVLSQLSDQRPGFPSQPPARSGFGNIELTPKMMLLSQGVAEVDASLAVAVVLPTTSSSDYLGDRGLGLVPEVAFSRDLGAGARAALNIGYRVRRSTRVLDLDVDDEWLARAGVAYRLAESGGPPLELAVTCAGSTGASHPFHGRNLQHAEILVGASYDAVHGNPLGQGPFQLFGAMGAGLAHGFGTPDFRAVLGLRVSSGR